MKIMDKAAFEEQNVFGLGAPNDAFARYFAGRSYLNPLTRPEDSLEPGRVIVIPAEVKHWHGAKRDSWFSHIAVEMPGEACSNEWCEPVSDAEYEAL